MTLQQHREILVQAEWMALLIGCVEYDIGDKQTAETTLPGEPGQPLRG